MVAARFKLSGDKQSACRFFRVVSQEVMILMADAVSSALKKRWHWPQLCRRGQPDLNPALCPLDGVPLTAGHFALVFKLLINSCMTERPIKRLAFRIWRAARDAASSLSCRNWLVATRGV